jgi:hypothetical protein
MLRIIGWQVRPHLWRQSGDDQCESRFDALLQQIGAALESDPTLGGLAFSLMYGRPEAAIEAVAGARAIKAATLTVTVDYDTDAPLA